MCSRQARLYSRTVHSCPFKQILIIHPEKFVSFYSGVVVVVVVLCGLDGMWPLAEVKVILTCPVAPCPMRMDSYLCKHYEIKSPLHASSMPLEDGPEIQNVMLCVFISVLGHQCVHSPELTNP